MPDGDKFYWGVRGVGSRTFLNLARNASTALDIVADQAAKVVTAQLKHPIMQRVLRESLRFLELGLPRLEADCSAGIPGPAVVHEQLRQLRREAEGDDFAVGALRTAEVLDAIPLTFSCDAFPLRRKGASQCGVCTSCLLRRLALLNADLQHRDMDGYRYDVYAPGDLLSDRHQRGAFEMHWQVARLTAALSQDNAWAGLVREFPGLAVAHQSLVGQLGLPASCVAEELVSLYRHHCEEWNRFPPSSWVPSQRKAA